MSMPETVAHGYKGFSKLNTPFALPAIWMDGALIMLPPSMLHFLNKPWDGLSGFDALFFEEHPMSRPDNGQ